MSCRVKICGLTQVEDAEAAIDFGAHALGFVFEPSSPRCMSDNDDLLEWMLDLGPFDPMTVGVFGAVNGLGLVDTVDAIQAVHWDFPGLQGGDPTDDLVELADYLHLVVIRPSPDLDLPKAAAMIDVMGADAVVVDAFSPLEYGGTGHRVDLRFVDQVREWIELPLVLAGGLNPVNVAEAIREIRPYAVDVSSGVESQPGIKDHDLMRRFIDAVHEA
ncbi:MAG: phosphoribosylanthranilate isomerase [Fimbriimonadaceae bacterium]|nr:phosphoribosylanthranilate isomerase [Fimbriimonadaceae bacterium]